VFQDSTGIFELMKQHIMEKEDKGRIRTHALANRDRKLSDWTNWNLKLEASKMAPTRG
jgi:hypothetical protein